MESELVLVPLVGLLASGLAGVALLPRSTSARALLACGALLMGAWVSEEAGLTRAGVDGVLLRLLSDGLFLGGLAAGVALLATYPGGGFERQWHRGLVGVLAVLAVLAAAARLLGERMVSVGLDPVTEVSNPVAVGAMKWLGTAGSAVVGSEPAWLLVGVGVLVARWRAASDSLRRDLGRLLASLALLAGLLVLILVGSVLDVWLPDALSTGLFLVALTLLPFELLRGITVRARSLGRELLASRQRIVEAEDRARRRIERDLHDGVQQQLVALLSLTELASHQAPLGGTPVRETLDDMRTLASTAIADLREVVSGIRPPVLEDSGVAAALESRFDRLPPTVTTDLASVRGRRFSAEVEATAYFVACECVTNALKHAVGSPVHVSLAVAADELTVTVRDRGPGRPEPPSTGTGLAGLRDRVESLGGRLLVESEPGRGWRVRATLPAERSA